MKSLPPIVQATRPQADVPEDYWSFDEASAMVETGQPKVAFILRWCGTGRVLDLGCNDGGIAHRIRQGGANVIAADRWPYAQVASRKYGLPAVALDANQKLPFDDGAFDAVVISGLLEYLDEPSKLLAEARRVVNPSGRLVLVAVNPNSIYHKYMLWRGNSFLYKSTCNLIELRRMLAATGFSVRTSCRLPYLSLRWRGRCPRSIQRCRYPRPW